jgi:hypothetical protein
MFWSICPDDKEKFDKAELDRQSEELEAEMLA